MHKNKWENAYFSFSWFENGKWRQRRKRKLKFLLPISYKEAKYFEQIEIVFNNSFPIINIKDDYNGNKKPKKIKKF